MKSNGYNEDGWDLYEEQTRCEFEEYACRKGYALARHPEYKWEYLNNSTGKVWDMYHHGHVKGRTWNA